MLVGLTSAIGFGAGLFTVQRAFAQTADQWLDAAMKKFNKSDYRGAISDDTKAIEISPYLTDAYNNRGLAKSELSDYQGAISDYNKLTNIKRNDSSAYCYHGFSKTI